MTVWIIVATVVVTVAAAVRSTWSPCGLSMLASITPLSEAGRGHRFRATAAWYVVGSTLGGASLGLFVGAVTVAVDAISLTSREAILVALGASAVAATSDAGLGGFHLPVHHRQVNERWLDRFRPWVYGAGFGWHIGTGLATYIMTAAVYLMIVLAALVGEPWLGVAFGVLFGLVRGLSVCLGRHITSAEALREFHRRFFEWGPRVGRITVAVEVMAIGLFAVLLSPWAVVALGAGAILWVVARTLRRGSVVANGSRLRRSEITPSGSIPRSHGQHDAVGGTP
jgi:hypothetical protein